MPELLLAIDVGTTALGAGLFTPGGELTGFASQRLVSVSPAPGRLEQDAEAIWKAARQVIAKVLDAAGRTTADLAGIGVTSQRTSAVVWDQRTGDPASPLVIWSDLRGIERAQQLRDAGYIIAPQQAAAKLEAIVAAVPADLRPHLLWGNIDSYLIWRLTGAAVHVTDRSQAWPTGYLALGPGLPWNDALIEHQGLSPAMFPALVDTWGVMGETSRAVMGAAVPIAADVADQQSALIAHGAQAGSAKVTYGTSATLDLSTGADFIYKSPSVPPFVLSSVGGDAQFCLEGMVYSAGSALDWLRGAFKFGDHTAFEALAAEAADPGGVWFLPALQGLGAPHGDAARRGAIGGLSVGSTRGQIARAAFEGLAFRIREVFEHVYGLTDHAPPPALGVVGGMTASDAFLQIQADLLGRPIRRHAHREATATGAAICAGLGVGLLTPADTAAFTAYDRTFEPAISADEATARYEAWKVAVYP
jgi:glycerol kinase